MKNTTIFLRTLLFSLLAAAFCGCSDEESGDNMIWELVSNSDADMIEVVIQNQPEDISSSAASNIWVNAGYKSGEVVLHCANHAIRWGAEGDDAPYSNDYMGFAVTKTDDSTIRIRFEEEASGKHEQTDRIVIVNDDEKHPSCLAFLWITRDFGEQQPDPDAIPDKYKFKIAKSGFSTLLDDDFPLPAPFDNLTFEIRDYQGRWQSPVAIPEFAEPYDSIVWSAKGLPGTYRIYEHHTHDYGDEQRFTSQWSSHFYSAGSLMTYAKGYSDGKAVYADSLRIDLYERDFLCFVWTSGNVLISIPHASGVYCLLDKNREYSVIPTRETDGTKYAEIHVWSHNNNSAEEMLAESKNALKQLMRENIGVGAPAQSMIHTFKCLPKGTDAELRWENKTTRIVLLHELPSDTTLEDYYLHIESK